MAIAIPKKKKYTYEDYAKLPEGAPYQLINGELIITPAPTPYHQYISGNIYSILKEFVEKNNLGQVYYSPIDVYFEETETYQPDIIFISKERLNIIKETKIEGAPNLIIEILSPATAYYDLRKKFKVYEKHGVKEYWIVDPEEKSIEIYINEKQKFILVETKNKTGTIKSQLLKNFEIELEKIF
ncbi:MAG: Uma2 family endonuclease [Candidatus Desulfofervidus auxilii]|nr:Uma2 family endonuclease [Candidatus Desulfofervidus auxilii]